MKINLTMNVPDELLKIAVQYIRNFTVQHDACDIEMTIEAPSMTMEEVKALIDDVKPPFRSVEVLAKQKVQ